MAAKAPRILMIEDDPTLARVYQEYLKNEPYSITTASTGRAGLAALSDDIPDAVLLDLKLPDMSGLDILGDIQARALPVTVIVITADGSLATAVDAMKAGAADFIVKPFNKDRLLVTLKNALEKQDLVRHVAKITEEFDGGRFCGFIGSSLAMRAVYRTIESCASSNATVFVTGESGTGKEICADAIHQLSPRTNKTFIALNCAAIPHDLMESEIFGHIKGAFTGAVADRMGAAAQADGGTLFLDEVCEMDVDLQAKLLRFIQTGTFLPIGGKDNQTVDVRFICATNKDPWEEVQAGRFREDLYYRLFVIPIILPPLRERDEDIMLIANSFLHQYAKEENKSFKSFSAEATKIITGFSWPGNVRQLQNVIRNLVVLNESETVEVDMLPHPLADGERPEPIAVTTASITAVKATVSEREITPMWQVEWDHIQHAVEICESNIPKAAAMLEVSPSTIYRRMKEREEAGQ